jgi:FkbM family methyltransferase
MTIHQFMYRYLKDPVIIEAGACDGQDSLIIANMFPNGKLYSFEPVPALYQKAQQKLKNKTNAKLYNMALSDREGEQQMHVAFEFDNNCGSSSLLKPKLHLEYYQRITFDEIINVKTTRLDDFVKKENLERVDFLWLDMQGYEPIVLMDSPETLKKTIYIQTETQNIETYEGVILSKEYKKFMEKSGFVLLFDDSKDYKDGGDLTYVNKEYYAKVMV